LGCINARVLITEYPGYKECQRLLLQTAGARSMEKAKEASSCKGSAERLLCISAARIGASPLYARKCEPRMHCQKYHIHTLYALSSPSCSGKQNQYILGVNSKGPSVQPAQVAAYNMLHVTSSLAASFPISLREISDRKSIGGCYSDSEVVV
jgi:hypothetical protein